MMEMCLEMLKRENVMFVIWYPNITYTKAADRYPSTHVSRMHIIL